MSEKTEVIKIFEDVSREAGKLISREFGKIYESKVQSKDLGDLLRLQI